MGGFNDCNHIEPLENAYQHHSFKLTLRQNLRRSRAYRLLTQIALRIPILNTTLPSSDSGPLAGSRLEACRQALTHGAERLEQHARSEHVELTFVSYPHPPGAEGGTIQAARNIVTINRMLASWADSAGASHIDLDPCFQPAASDAWLPLFTMDGVHLTEAGCSLTAACLADHFQDLIPSGI